MEPTTDDQLSSGRIFWSERKQDFQGERRVNASENDILGMLCHSMSNLSAEEREKSIYDIYGLNSATEDVDDIKSQLKRLDRVIHNITPKASYELAYSTNAEYVRSLRIMFLRAERYNVKKAANRMIGFFERKENLFGAEKLTKDISLNDLDDDDKIALGSGFIQVLPEKDRAGRAVLLLVPAMKQYRDTLNLVRGKKSSPTEAADQR